jgi:hypothetical protein
VSRTLDINAAIADRVARAIALSGSTLEQVADRAGMRRMVLRWRLACPGRSPLLDKELESIARALEVPVRLLTEPHLRAAS